MSGALKENLQELTGQNPDRIYCSTEGTFMGVMLGKGAGANIQTYQLREGVWQRQKDEHVSFGEDGVPTEELVHTVELGGGLVVASGLLFSGSPRPRILELTQGGVNLRSGTRLVIAAEPRLLTPIP